MQNGDRKLLMGDSFPVYLSCMYDIIFHLFQFSNYLLFNKSISNIAISVQKKSAEEKKKESHTYKSNELHFAFLHIFRNYKKKF